MSYQWNEFLISNLLPLQNHLFRAFEDGYLNVDSFLSFLLGFFHAEKDQLDDHSAHSQIPKNA